MINISYYCLVDDANCPELEAFKSVHDISFRNSYNHHSEEELITHLYFKSESYTSFFQNELVDKELKNGDNALPLVIINNEIIKRGNLLTVEELSELLGIGISIQSDD